MKLEKTLGKITVNGIPGYFETVRVRTFNHVYYQNGEKRVFIASISGGTYSDIQNNIQGSPNPNAEKQINKKINKYVANDLKQTIYQSVADQLNRENGNNNWDAENVDVWFNEYRDLSEYDSIAEIVEDIRASGK
jgi:hypothetical protein